jgi:hypothetical protein
MGFHRRINSKTHDKTTACISKCVMNLLLRQFAIRQWINVEVSRLLIRCKIFKTKKVNHLIIFLYLQTDESNISCMTQRSPCADEQESFGCLRLVNFGITESFRCGFVQRVVSQLGHQNLHIKSSTLANQPTEHCVYDLVLYV